jgi:hypothetical protein
MSGGAFMGELPYFSDLSVGGQLPINMSSRHRRSSPFRLLALVLSLPLLSRHLTRTRPLEP